MEANNSFHNRIGTNRIFRIRDNASDVICILALCEDRVSILSAYSNTQMICTTVRDTQDKMNFYAHGGKLYVQNLLNKDYNMYLCET